MQPPEVVKKAVAESIVELYIHDFQLLKEGAHEQSVSHWLAIYIGDRFPGWDVDCEYNRQDSIGRARAPKSVSRGRVRPDIVVHRRGGSANLLVVELKTTAGPSLKNARDTLKTLTSAGRFRYQFGLLLHLTSSGCQLAESYEKGQMKGDWTSHVQKQLAEFGFGPEP